MPVQVTFFLLNNDPKCKSSDAGKSYTPKRSRKVLPLSEEVQVRYYAQFQASFRGLGTYPPQIRGNTILILFSSQD